MFPANRHSLYIPYVVPIYSLDISILLCMRRFGGASAGVG